MPPFRSAAEGVLRAIDELAWYFSYRGTRSSQRVWQQSRQPAGAVGIELLDRHGGIHKGRADRAEQPDQRRRSCDLVHRQSGPSRWPEPEQHYRYRQRDPHGRNRLSQLHGYRLQLRRQRHGDLDHHRQRSAAFGAQLHPRLGDLHQGDTDRAEPPHKQRRGGGLIQREPGASRRPEPECGYRYHQRKPDSSGRRSRVYGNGI